jgi:hypothetical protein
MHVRDLKHWPPHVKGEGWHSTPSSKHAVVKKVVHAHTDWIIFSCEFDGELYAYDLEITDEITLLKVKAILEENIGKSLFSIGNIEIPEGPLTLPSG